MRQLDIDEALGDSTQYTEHQSRNYQQVIKKGQLIEHVIISDQSLKNLPFDDNNDVTEVKNTNSNLHIALKGQLWFKVD